MKSKHCEDCKVIESTYNTLDICQYCNSWYGSIYTTENTVFIPFKIVFDEKSEQPKFCPHCGGKL